ncbi:hypothetical protein [Thaumasiovibrio subtropicus]|uniref:hypothetical protein n=1 Tax=Thaumasiovibrio subtropicus TaxID=1891207 RepID=UPI000B3563C3|nr:hypothetical protein [Thaumasiovibrio subtropicus]
MGSQRLLYEMMPKGYGTPLVESFDTWLSRHHEKLPHFPPCVLEQWLYSHWQAVIYRWGWMDFSHVEFEKSALTTAQCLMLVQTPFSDVINLLSRRMQGRSFHQDPLIAYFRRHHTWRIPPIVYQHERDFVLVDNRHFHAGYSLIEGHHRWAALLAAVEAEHCHPNQIHDVWMMKSNKKGP